MTYPAIEAKIPTLPWSQHWFAGITVILVAFTTTAEAACPALTASDAYSDEMVQWMHNANTPPGAPANNLQAYIRQPTFVASASNESFNSLTVAVPNTENHIDTSSIPAALDTSKYIGYSFTTPAFSGSATLYGVGLGVHADSRPVYEKRSGAYRISVKMDTDPAFASPTKLVNEVRIDDTQPTLDADVSAAAQDLGSSLYTFNHYQADQTEALLPNTTYYVRVYPYNASRSGYDPAYGSNQVIYDDFTLKLKDCSAGTISGAVYVDADSNNSYDSGVESGIGAVTVNLLNQASGAVVATTSTAADGQYSFSNLDPVLTYRISVDTADTDLGGKTIGTPNPLNNVTVVAGSATTDQDFGFDPLFPTQICGKTVDNPLELDFSGTATLVSGTAKQPGSVYRFSNVANGVDALVTMNALQADSLPRWLDGDLGGQLQGAQANKFFDMTVNLVKTATTTATSPVDLVLTSFDLDGSAGEPYSDGVEYFSPAATFTGKGSQLQASDMGGSIRYTLPLSARGVDDPTAVDPKYAAGAVYTNITSFRTKGLVVDDNGSSTRSIFIYANAASFKQFGTLECDSQVSVSTVSGVIFEDVDYGGGAGRAFGTAGTTGVNGARVELYDSAGQYLNSTVTGIGGNYSFELLPDGNYFIRVVNDTVSSSRAGSDGSELAVQTYRRNSANAVTNEIGGRKPAVADAPANTIKLQLNTSSFTFPGSAQVQSVQPVSVTGSDISGVSFGFNFDTIVNTNDNGQGSLRQFLLNASLLGGDASLVQTGRAAGKENAILALPTSDPNYSDGVWKIALATALPNIDKPLVLDGSKQATFNSTTAAPVVELNGKGGAGNGLTLVAGSTGSQIRSLAITRFSGDGVNVQGGTTDNAILGNSIHDNGRLGINLVGSADAASGVTANDANDADSGPNDLLNYPDVQATSFGANGSKIITHDFTLDVPAGDYRLEFFKSASKDPSGNGEGETFLGGKDFSHPGTGALNFKGSFNANQAVSSAEFITVTVTRKTGAASYGSTSEFSGATNNNTALVCTDLLSNPGAALPDLMIDENAATVTYLKAKDSSGNPITYAISGGVDGNMFTIAPPVNGTVDCSQLQFVKYVIVKNAPSQTRVVIPGGLPAPGNFEVPLDQGKDNVYDLEITATDSNGQQYVHTLSVGVMDVNEAPIITSSAAVSVEENGSTLVLDINSQDQDAGDVEGEGLSYTFSGGADQQQFTLDSQTGVLNFKAIPDHDAPTDQNQDNVYETSVTDLAQQFRTSQEVRALASKSTGLR